MSEQQNLIVFYILSALTICIGEGISDVSTNGNRNAIPCGKGQFYFNANITEDGKNVYQRCKLCPVGTYNDQDVDVSRCSPCPEHGRYPVHTRPGADSTSDCVFCAGRCEKNNPSSCYTPEQKCNGVSDCAYGQDEASCDSMESDEETPTSASRYQKYSWFFFIPVPFVICAGFGKLYHTQKNRGLPVNAETGSPIRIHFRPQVSGRSRNRTRRSSNPVTIEMPLISNGNANGSPSNHTQVSRSPSNQSQRTRSSQGSVCLSPSGQHLTVVGDDRSSRRSSATSQRSRSGSHGSRSFSRSPRLGNDSERQRASTRTVQPAVLVLPNQMQPRHVPLRSSVSLPPFPFPSPMSTISHPAGSPPLPVVLSASPPPPSYEEVVTSSNAYPPHSPPHIDGVRSKRLKLPSYEAATRNALSSTSSA